MGGVIEPLIRAANLEKTFPGTGRKEPRVPVLRGISLDVHPGEMVSIVGPSGSGKSTLLYCLSGLEPYDTGSVHLAGRELSSLRRGALAALRRRHVGFVFQSFNLIPLADGAVRTSRFRPACAAERAARGRLTVRSPTSA